MRRRRPGPEPIPRSPDGIPVWPPPGGRGPVRVYKGGRVPKGSRLCAACYPAKRPGARVPLRGGGAVALCADHRSRAFLRSRSGRDFIASMCEALHSFGIDNSRVFDGILQVAHEATRVGGDVPRPRPGSYAWPEVRLAAEGVWRAGGTFEHGVAVASRLCTDLPKGVRPPSIYTLRRWWRERRWIFGDCAPVAAERRPARERTLADLAGPVPGPVTDCDRSVDAAAGNGVGDDGRGEVDTNCPGFQGQLVSDGLPPPRGP